MKICITGYRPSKLPARYGYDIDNAAYQNLGSTILDTLSIILLKNRDTKLECISGMALGTDQLYVRVAEKIKNSAKNYPSVTITAAVPCWGQEKKWPIPNRELYHKLLALCDHVHYVTNDNFTPSCMEERNRWMVDNSDAVIAIWDGKSGGTANCIRYAKQKNRPIYYINPDTLRIREGRL